MTGQRGRPAPRPVDKVRSVWLPPRLRERIEEYAKVNAMSVSEAIREFMEAYATGKPVPVNRERSTSRVTIWLGNDEYLAFSKRRAADKVTVAAAIEAAMDEIA